jgi:4-cresol dehydrogenase (hydroxylating)
MARHGFDYVAEANAIWRAAHHDQLLPHSAGTGAGTGLARAQACARELIAAQASAGFGQVTADPSLVPAAAATYAANGGSLGDLHRRIKTALDPRGLFASV